jgi:hypothetical protein
MISNKDAKEFNRRISEYEKTLPIAFVDFQDDEYAESAPYGVDFYTWVRCYCPTFEDWKLEQMNQFTDSLIKEFNL